MNHNKSLRKLNRTSSHRKALLINLASALFKHERIKTTLPKAKTLRPFSEKLITAARNQNLNSRRKLLATLRDEAIVGKLLEDISVRSSKRPGGYTRIYKAGFRYGDQAPMAIIELVDRKIISSNSPKKSSTKKKDQVIEASAEEVTTEKVKSPRKVKSN